MKCIQIDHTGNVEVQISGGINAAHQSPGPRFSIATAVVEDVQVHGKTLPFVENELRSECININFEQTVVYTKGGATAWEWAGTGRLPCLQNRYIARCGWRAPGIFGSLFRATILQRHQWNR